MLCFQTNKRDDDDELSGSGAIYCTPVTNNKTYAIDRAVVRALRWRLGLMAVL